MNDYSPPDFDMHWSDLEAVIDAPLSASHRAEITSAANLKIVDAYNLLIEATGHNMPGKMDAARNIKQSTPTLKILRAMDEICRSWQALKKNEDQARVILQYDAQLRPELRRFEALMGDIQFHKISLSRALKNAGRENQKTARKISFEHFVNRIEATYKDATGSQVTSALARDGSDQTPPFVEFIRRIDGLLPNEARRGGADTPLAWSKAIGRALRSMGQTQGEFPPTSVP